MAKLKKEVDELTKQNKALKEQQAAGGCERCGGGIASGAAGAVGDGLPREPEKFTLRGHKSRVTKVAMHPVYHDVVSASEDGSVKMWDFDQGELTHTLKGHTGSVNYVAIHPAGGTLATCSTDQTIKLWNY